MHEHLAGFLIVNLVYNLILEKQQTTHQIKTVAHLDFSSPHRYSLLNLI